MYSELRGRCPITETVTIKGMIGFNKTGTPEEVYPWTRTFALTKDSKVLVTTTFEVPDQKSFKRKGGIFFTLMLKGKGP